MALKPVLFFSKEDLTHITGKNEDDDGLPNIRRHIPSGGTSLCM